MTDKEHQLPARITLEWLREHKACAVDLHRFPDDFPDGHELSLESLTRAAGLNYDINWLAANILTATALEAYEQATATAWEACEQAKATALEAYYKAAATAWEAYEQAKATAWEAYRKAKAPALYEVIRQEAGDA